MGLPIMYEQLLNLDPVKINFSKSGMDMLNIALAIVMYGVALGIKPGTFADVFRKPKSILVGILALRRLMLFIGALMMLRFIGSAHRLLSHVKQKCP